MAEFNQSYGLDALLSDSGDGFEQPTCERSPEELAEIIDEMESSCSYTPPDDEIEEVLRAREQEQDNANLPTTYEEWVEIYGEPEYLFESNGSPELDIVVVDPTEEEELEIMDDIFYEDKRGKHLDETEYCRRYKAHNNCVYNNGLFYSIDGAMNADMIHNDIIVNLMEAGMKNKLGTSTKALYNALKMFSTVERLNVNAQVFRLQTETFVFVITLRGNFT